MSQTVAVAAVPSTGSGALDALSRLRLVAFCVGVADLLMPPRPTRPFGAVATLVTTFVLVVDAVPTAIQIAAAGPDSSPRGFLRLESWTSTAASMAIAPQHYFEVTFRLLWPQGSVENRPSLIRACACRLCPSQCERG